MGADTHMRNNRSSPTTPTLKLLLDLDSRFKSRTPTHDHVLHELDLDNLLPLITCCTSSRTTTTYPPNNSLESPSSHHNPNRHALLHLLSLLKNPPSKILPLPEHILSSLFTMISSNLFRPLPAPPPPPTTKLLLEDDGDDDDNDATTPASSTAWPHLSLVYDILLRLVVNLEAKALTNYINYSFIVKLLNLFQSQDTRERDRLKNVCHKIYSRLHTSRSFIRKATTHVFLDYIFKTTTTTSSDQEQCRIGIGIGDLLEIWGSIINGFSVPLKEEHKFFLTKVLVPLHRPRGMPAYHKQLAYCIYQFVEKEPGLGIEVVRSILRYWPKTNCQKEVLLIGELEELVDRTEPEQYRIQLALPLCTQITKCLNSCNTLVAERAHYVWNKERFVKMAVASKAVKQVFPVIVGGLEKNLREHWSGNVRELTQNVKEMLEGMEPVLYAKCKVTETDQHQSRSRSRERERERERRWERVEMEAQINQFIRQLQAP